MPLGINGYNDAFKAFTDFAKVMTEGKGKPLTARRSARGFSRSATPSTPTRFPVPTFSTIS